LEWVGVQEDFLAEDISYALEKYLEKVRDQGGELLTVEALNGHVVSLLTDAGYGEVAYAYSSLNESTWEFKTSKELERWDLNRALRLMKHNLLFQSYDLSSLSQQVNKAIANFKFSKVSDSFIVELLLHFIGNQESVVTPPVASESEIVHFHGNKLFYASEVVAFSSKEFQELFGNGVLKASDIGHIFPKFAIDLDFTVYVASCVQDEGVPLMELCFIPQFTKFVEDIASFYAKMNKFLELTLPGVAISKRFNICGLDVGIQDGFKLNSRNKMKFRQELLDLVRALFSTHCPVAVEVFNKNDS
jgi:hypothetical protein